MTEAVQVALIVGVPTFATACFGFIIQWRAGRKLDTVATVVEAIPQVIEAKAEEAKVDLGKQNETLAGIEHKTDGTLSEVTQRAAESDRRADILSRQVQRLIDAQENGKEHRLDA